MIMLMNISGDGQTDWNIELCHWQAGFVGLWHAVHQWTLYSVSFPFPFWVCLSLAMCSWLPGFSVLWLFIKMSVLIEVMCTICLDGYGFSLDYMNDLFVTDCVWFIYIPVCCFSSNVFFKCLCSFMDFFIFCMFCTMAKCSGLSGHYFLTLVLDPILYFCACTFLLV